MTEIMKDFEMMSRSAFGVPMKELLLDCRFIGTTIQDGIDFLYLLVLVLSIVLYFCSPLNKLLAMD